MAGAPFCFPFFGLIPSQQNDTIMLNTNSVNGSVRPSLGRWEMEAWLFLQWKRALNPAFTSEKPILEGNRVYGSVYVVQYCRPSLGPVNCKTVKQSFCQSITFASYMHVSCLKKIKKKKKKEKSSSQTVNTSIWAMQQAGLTLSKGVINKHHQKSLCCNALE